MNGFASYTHWRLARANLGEEAGDEPEEDKDVSTSDSAGDAIELALKSCIFQLVAEGFMIKV